MSNPVPVTYDVIKEYQNGVPEPFDDSGIQNDGVISVAPGWCLAVIRLGSPLTYSRKLKKSVGNPESGAFVRRDKPLIIKDCIQLRVSRDKKSHVKRLSAVIKGDINYLSANSILPGDWLFAWCHNNEDDTNRIIKQVLAGESANEFMDGLKFVGRVYSIRKKVSVNKRAKTVTYFLEGAGFQELDTRFYYNLMLATSAKVSKNINISQFMASIGLNFTDFVEGEIKNTSWIKDNMERLIPAVIDIIIGRGGSNNIANRPVERMYEAAAVENPLLSKELQDRITALNEDVPYAYMIPVSAAQILGKTSVDKSKRVFGYSDILHLLTGVQQYSKDDLNKPSKGLWPMLDPNNLYPNRSFCLEKLKSTYLPTNAGVYVNRPLWQILEQFLNPVINEMYTALKVGPEGTIIPTLVTRQIPFSTQTIEEMSEFRLTRFLELPRWKIDPVMVRDLDISRDDATHFNMVRVLGDPTMFSNTEINNPSKQEVRNPPIFDNIDIGRSGIRPYDTTVNCSVQDVVRKDGFAVWTLAVADWTLGMHYTLNGSVECVGIQSPIAEGDNIELEGIVYHIESITDTCAITDRGRSFTTSLALSMGMPADQRASSGEISEDFPRYPGFDIDVKAQQTPIEVPNMFITPGSSEVDKDFVLSTIGTMQVPEETDSATGNDAELTNVDPGIVKEEK